MTFILEFWQFLRKRKKLWLLPLVAAMLILGAIMFFAQGSAVAPFLYTLF